MIDTFKMKHDNYILYRLHHEGLHFANIIQHSSRRWEMELVGYDETLIFKSKRDCLAIAERYILECPKQYRKKSFA